MHWSKNITFFKVVNFLYFWSSKTWIRKRIRIWIRNRIRIWIRNRVSIDLKSWIRIRICTETNADPLIQYLHAPGGDLPGEGEGGAVRVGEVDILQLHHHLTHYVVPAVPVKAQHNKVQRQDLKKGKITFRIKEKLASLLF